MNTGQTALNIRDLHKSFSGKNEKVTALAGVSLEVREGELFTLLGPSGCGKTTTLRCVAGFEQPTAGSISFRGDDFTAVPPFRRNIGMVFQSYALFPHLSIHENVAYGLRVRRVPRSAIGEKVRAILQLVGLEGAGNRKPGELSGGQQQRVALARALVYDPRLLLLDEPLSNLDAKLRIYMREEIRRIQQQAGVTTIYVTHDQEEALSISDRLAVMHAGKVSQVGSPDEIYQEPASIRVADFIGQANFLPCRISRAGPSVNLRFASGDEITAHDAPPNLRGFNRADGVLFVRPEHARILAPGSAGAVHGRVLAVLYLGSEVRYFLEVPGSPAGRQFQVDANRRIPGVKEGDAVSLSFEWDGARLFPADQLDQLAAV
jgi:ABC-type Fe3+/spermidine/putrescine transport system ATPase subunit